MSDYDETEKLIGSWRSTTSGEDEPQESWICVVCGKENPGDGPYPCDHVPNCGSLEGLEEDGILSQALPSFIPSGVLSLDLAAGAPVSGFWGDGYQFSDASYVNTSADGVFELQTLQPPTAIILDDGNGGGVKINFNGKIEVLGDTTIGEAAQLFWEIVEIEGINRKEHFDALEKEKLVLSDRVKELEIKLGYRKCDGKEEKINRFEEILDEE